jgi:putative protein kinase ArgK-like GTPase of G3E family
VIVETPGIGQGDAAIADLADLSLYVMTPEFGAASQLEKIDMLDFADLVAINKFDRKGAEDALRDVRKQVQRNREAFMQSPDTMPVFGTIASRFQDDGVTGLYLGLRGQLADKNYNLPPTRFGASRAIRRRRASRSCRRRASAIWPKSPTRCAAITRSRRPGEGRARAAAAARHRSGCWAGKGDRRCALTADRRARRQAGRRRRAS